MTTIIDRDVATVPVTRIESARVRGRTLMTGVLLACILCISGVSIMMSMRATSTTFDEIVFVAAGARGFATGSFDLARDHPPLMQYVYGLPAVLMGARLPDESVVSPAVQQHPGYRYTYAQQFFWRTGNDPERIAFGSRLPAVAFALLLIVAAFAFTRRYWGDGTALTAAALVAFLPDVLGHGGVAYSDLPATLLLFLAAWAMDEAIREPTWKRGLTVGTLVGLAFSIKATAVILAPLGAALVAIEIVRRRTTTATAIPHDRRWTTELARSVAVACAAAYVVLALVYRGDWLLEEFRYGIAYRAWHFETGHGAPAYLIGNTSTTGWWYFFPLAFLFKTSAGLHALMIIAVAALSMRLASNWKRVQTSRLRAPLLGCVLFGAVLVSSNLNIGFRYAMPMLPWLCVITAVGVGLAWKTMSPLIRPAIVALVIWTIAYPLTYYPHFLTFISEYGPDRDENYRVLVDSSLDWGQGLLALREFMRENGIPRIYLSYFGSADPGGYGIDYTPLASFQPLPARTGGTEPEWVAISATNLFGLYLQRDPFEAFRSAVPTAVVAHSILLYHLPTVQRAQ